MKKLKIKFIFKKVIIAILLSFLVSFVSLFITSDIANTKEEQSSIMIGWPIDFVKVDYGRLYTILTYKLTGIGSTWEDGQDVIFESLALNVIVLFIFFYILIEIVSYKKKQ